MKKSYLFITTLLMVAAVAAVVVSCKKETSSDLMNNKKESAQSFNPREIEDMNAYLKDFKQKMQSAAKGEDEALPLDEAAWHLSSLANYDFGHANAKCDDVRFDTLYSSVTITNGSVLLSDLAIAYNDISTNIDKFFHNLMVDNKHFRFIDVSIDENGKIMLPIMTTFINSAKYLGDTCWYYDDIDTALIACYTYFTLPSYPYNTTGASALERALNRIVSIETLGNSHNYFTATTTTLFYYRNHIDPFGSPCYMDSRLYASTTENDDIILMMCYLLDSYLGLGYGSCPTDEYILNWEITPISNEPPMQGEHLSKQYHQLQVKYGTMHELEPSPGHDNEY